MLYSSLAILAGISLFLTFMPITAWQAAVPLVFLSGMPWRPLRLAGIAVAGFLCCGWQLAQTLEQHLPRSLENRDLHIEGVIRGLPEIFPDGRVRFRFEIECYRDDADCQPFPLMTRLSWYRSAPELHSGERWALRVRLKRPHGFANPGGFVYERWLLAAGIRATGYVRGKRDNQRISEVRGFALHTLRERIANDISTRLGNRPEAALLTALGVGDRSQMTTLHWDVLRATGTSHLLAISGLHVGLVSALVFFVVRRLWGWTGLCGHWPARHVAALASIAAALGYALLSGFQVPAQRALIMISVFMLSGFASQRPSPWHSWSLALALVLLLNPLAALTPGFWLSFGAVAAILYLAVGYHGYQPRWRAICRLQLCLAIALLPLSWVWFQQLSVIAPLANVLAIPWVGFLVVPPLLVALLCLTLWPGASDWLLMFACSALQLLWQGLEWLAGLPGNLLHLPAFTLPGMALAVLGIAAALAPKALPVRLIGILLLVPVLFGPPLRPARGDVWLTVLDVGQGLSAVVQTHQRVLVFDTGPAFRSGFNTGEAVVVPYLRWHGYRFVDRLLLSHADNDHAGGAAAVLTNFSTGLILAGEPGALDIAEVRACHAGQQWMWDGVVFDILSPGDDSDAGNNASCVLRVTAGDGRSVLMPGDIERKVERRLLRRVPDKLSASVLLAPHHGSLTSSTPAFVAAVNAAVIVFSSGYLNRFGFPKDEVSRRYRATGAILLNTADEGSIQVQIERGEPIAVRRHRQLRHFGILPKHAREP